MRSPILRAEFSHQTTAGGSTARPLRLIVRLILIVGLATSLLVAGRDVPDVARRAPAEPRSRPVHLLSRQGEGRL